MTPIEHTAYRIKLSISASEYELLMHITECPGLSLSALAERLAMSKKGVDKAAARLVEKNLLTKTANGKLAVVEQSTTKLTPVSIVVLSTTNNKIVEQSTTIDTEVFVEQSTTNAQIVEQSTTKFKEEPKIVEQSTTIGENAEQSTTILPDALAYAGSINNNNYYNNKKILITRKKKEEKNKINPQPPNKNKKEESEKARAEGRLFKMAEIESSFEKWWELYDYKKGDKKKLLRIWAQLTDLERQSAMTHAPSYILLEAPDKQFRKHPQTYLNQKSFNDEIVPKYGNTGNVSNRNANSYQHSGGYQQQRKVAPEIDLAGAMARRAAKQAENERIVVEADYSIVG